LEGQPADEKYSEGPNEKTLDERIKLMVEKIENGRVVKREASFKVSEVKPADGKEEKKEHRKRELPVQQYNVEVKSNQNNFREFYYKQVRSFLKKVALDKSVESAGVPTIE
jgi:hypothetical protein